MPPIHPSQADVAAAYRTLIAHETEPKEQDFYRTRLQRLEQATESVCEFDCRSRVAVAGVGVYCPQCSVKCADTDLTTQLAKAIRAAWVDRLDWDELAHAALKFLNVAGRLVPAGGMALTAEQVEDVRLLLGLNGTQDIKVVLDAQERLRALFPATEPAERSRELICPCRGRFGFHDCNTVSAPAEPAEEVTQAEGFCSFCGWSRDACARGEGDCTPAEPAEEHCTVPPEGWWCSRAANHNGPCAASEGVAPWVPQPLEADWLDQVDPRDPQSRTHRETAAAKFAEAAEEETKAEGSCTGSGGHYLYPCVLPAGHAGVHADSRGLKWQNPASSPVIPAPTETGPWPSLLAVPVTVQKVKDAKGYEWHRRGSTDGWRGCNGADAYTSNCRTGHRDSAPFIAAEEG